MKEQSIAVLDSVVAGDALWLRALKLVRDFVYFYLLMLLTLIVLFIVLPVRVVDKVLNTKLQEHLISVLVALAH